MGQGSRALAMQPDGDSPGLQAQRHKWSSLAPPRLSFLVYKIGVIMVPSSQDSRRAKCVSYVMSALLPESPFKRSRTFLGPWPGKRMERPKGALLCGRWAQRVDPFL